MHCTDSRERDVAVQAAQLLANLWRTPGAVFFLQLHDERLDLEGKSVCLPIRPARAIGESFESALSVAVKDLKPCFAGDIELPAQYRHLLAFQHPSHKPKPFIHLVTLLPRHFASPAKA